MINYIFRILTSPPIVFSFFFFFSFFLEWAGYHSKLGKSMDKFIILPENVLWK